MILLIERQYIVYAVLFDDIISDAIRRHSRRISRASLLARMRAASFQQRLLLYFEDGRGRHYAYLLMMAMRCRRAYRPMRSQYYGLLRCQARKCLGAQPASSGEACSLFTCKHAAVVMRYEARQ